MMSNDWGEWRVALDELVMDVISLTQRNEVRELVERRLQQFKTLGKEGSCDDIFSELSFCILTANFSAEKGIAIQKAIGVGFLMMTQQELEQALRKMGHRYPQKRAEFIVKNRPLSQEICRMVKKDGSGKTLRDWLCKNVYGFGLKEASHFLRNVGFSDVAIIDFHIIDLLAKYGLIEKPKSLTRKRYIEIEKILEAVAKRIGIGLDALDLYLWFMETGKVLK
jgi:N-glycosylase/DNA lyase